MKSVDLTKPPKGAQPQREVAAVGLMINHGVDYRIVEVLIEVKKYFEKYGRIELLDGSNIADDKENH
jgi:hypothetical protein